MTAETEAILKRLRKHRVDCRKQNLPLGTVTLSPADLEMLFDFIESQNGPVDRSQPATIYGIKVVPEAVLESNTGDWSAEKERLPKL